MRDRQTAVLPFDQYVLTPSEFADIAGISLDLSPTSSAVASAELFARGDILFRRMYRSTY